MDPEEIVRETPVLWLPQPDLESETCVLGAVLLDQEALPKISQQLRPEHFANQNHRQVYAAGLRLQGQGVPVDLVTVAGELERQEILERVGGRGQLALWQEKVPSALNVEYYARAVLENHRRRGWIVALNKASSQARDGRLEDSMEELRAFTESMEPASLPEPEIAEPPPFPVDVLPGAARVWVKFLARDRGLSADFAGAYALGILAGAVGGKAEIQYMQGWSRRAILWIGLVAEAGFKKSPILAMMRGPIDARISQLEQEWKRDYAQWAEAEKATRGPQPVKPRLLAGNSTIEALWDVLAGPGGGGMMNQDGSSGLLMAADELRAIVEGLGAYKTGQNPDRAHFLELHAGLSFPIDRKKGSIRVERPTVSIVGGIQPGLVYRLSGGDGLLERFLLAKPWRAEKFRLKGRQFNEAAFLEAQEGWADLVGGLLNERNRERIVVMDGEARELFADAADRWQEHSEQGDCTADLAGFLRKSPDHCLSLALVLAEARRIDEGGEERVTGSDMGGAVQLLDYFIGHRQGLSLGEYNLLAGSRQQAEKERAVERLEDALLRADDRRLTRRQIQIQHVGGARTPTQVDQLLAEYEVIHPGFTRMERTSGRAAKVAYHPSVALLPTVATVATKDGNSRPPGGSAGGVPSSHDPPAAAFRSTPGNSGNSGNSQKEETDEDAGSRRSRGIPGSDSGRVGAAGDGHAGAVGDALPGPAVPLPRGYAPGGPDHSRPWSNPRQAAVAPPRARKWEASDPGALIAVLGPDGRLVGRTPQPSAAALAEALPAVAHAGARQLWVIRQPTEGELADARASGWEISFRPENMAWATARHPDLMGNGWLDLVIPELEPDVRRIPEKLRQLTAGQLLEALQSVAHLLGQRLAISPAYTWQYLATGLNKGRTLEVAQLPSPAASWDEDHVIDDNPTWSRDPNPAERARKWAYSFDRAGSWLAAFAGFEIGMGDLVQLDEEQARQRLAQGKPTDLVGYWYVRLTGPDPMVERGLPRILERPEGWATDPTLALLKETGASFEVKKAELWTAHTRYFDRAQAKMREARKATLERRDPVGEVVYDLLKLIYGGGGNRLRYKGAPPDYFRPDVYEALVARSRANLQRSLWASSAVVIRYYAKDTITLLSNAETAAEAGREAGLPYGRQLGQWHEIGRKPTELQPAPSRKRRAPDSQAIEEAMRRLGRRRHGR